MRAVQAAVNTLAKGTTGFCILKNCDFNRLLCVRRSFSFGLQAPEQGG